MRFASAQVTLTGVEIERSGRVLARDISFTASAGDIVELRGANGSGKTTLLRTIAGFRRASVGAIERSWDADALHFVGHANALKAALSVRAHLKFWAALLGASPDAVETSLATMNLAPLADLSAGSLSQGQARRLALARLLTAARPIWLLDEPAAGLDAASEAMLTQLLDAHRRDGGVVIAAVHEKLPVQATQTITLAAA